MINHIIDYALKNKLLVLLLTGLMSAVGLFVYQQLPKDIYPDLNAPLVNIITTCPGMASEDVERLITFPLESLMNGSPHVTRVRSESTTGESVVTVEFDWGIDIYQARQIVAGKLDIVAEQLPPAPRGRSWDRSPRGWARSSSSPWSATASIRWNCEASPTGPSATGCWASRASRS